MLVTGTAQHRHQIHTEQLIPIFFPAQQSQSLVFSVYSKCSKFTHLSIYHMLCSSRSREMECRQLMTRHIPHSVPIWSENHEHHAQVSTAVNLHSTPVQFLSN